MSELVTNALQADCHHLSLTLNAHHSYVRITTGDDAPGDPVLQHPTADENHGRGLLIVAALSTCWGVDYHNGRKRVWADVPLTGNVGPSFHCGE